MVAVALVKGQVMAGLLELGPDLVQPLGLGVAEVERGDVDGGRRVEDRPAAEAVAVAVGAFGQRAARRSRPRSRRRRNKASPDATSVICSPDSWICGGLGELFGQHGHVVLPRL